MSFHNWQLPYKKNYYVKRQPSYHQCSACNAFVKGQRGISIHKNYCSGYSLISTFLPIVCNQNDNHTTTQNSLLNLNGGTVTNISTPFSSDYPNNHLNHTDTNLASSDDDFNTPEDYCNNPFPIGS